MIDREIKAIRYKDVDEGQRILEENIKLYLDFFDEKLKVILEEDADHHIKEFDGVNLRQNSNGNYCYFILINSDKLLKHRNYNSIMSGPIKEIYELFGVENIYFNKPDGIEVSYPIQFFLQEDFFNSLKAINKFGL